MGPNRLVLLISNTQRLEVNKVVSSTVTDWSDVQIFEMQAGGSDWLLPFDVDLNDKLDAARRRTPTTTATGYQARAAQLLRPSAQPRHHPGQELPDAARADDPRQGGHLRRWYVGNLLTTASRSTRPRARPTCTRSTSTS